MTNGQRIVMGDHMHEHSHFCLSCISWTAIFVGAFVGIGLSFLLNLFSVAIGLSAFSTTTDTGAMTVAVGGLLGVLIGVIVSMFLAGFVAGYLGRSSCPKRNLGVLYGFTAWSLALILTVLMASSVGHYVAAYSQFIANPTDIVTTHDASAPAVSGTTRTNPNEVVVNAEKAKTAVPLGAFVVFILFALGAFFSCLGGHWGMCCREDDEHVSRM